MTDANQIRINELARELEVKAKFIVDYLPEVGVTEKKTHSSSIDLAAAEKVRRHFREAAEAEAAAEAKTAADKIAQEAAAKAARLRPQPVPAPAAPATATPAAQGLVPAAGAKTPEQTDRCGQDSPDYSAVRGAGLAADTAARSTTHPLDCTERPAKSQSQPAERI